MDVPAGSTDVSVPIRCLTGAGAALTGKVAADFTLWYRRDGAKTAIALSDLSALTDAHDDGGLFEIGDGWYRLDVPDAAFAAGTHFAAIGGSVTGGVVITAPLSLLDVGSTGTGARSVTVTVDDGADPIAGATVRATLQPGGASRKGTTDGSGQVALSLDDGTYTISITKPGYSFTPESLVVDGTETPTYSMTLEVTPPADPDLCTGYLYCYDENGAAEQSVTVTVTAKLPQSTAGFALDDAAQTDTSDADGLVEFTLFKGATYFVKRGTGDRQQFTAPTDEDTFAIESLVGTDA